MISKNRPSWMQPRMKLFYRIILAMAWSYFKIFHRHRVYGWEHYYKGAAIIACNHTSFFDPPIASISWPEEVHFLARESLFINPLFGKLIRSLNAHPVSGDAADIKVFRTIGEILKEGKKIILFPEGTRSRGGEFSEIKPGIALLMMRNQAAIIPTYIHGSHKALGRGQKLPRLFAKTACVYGTPILWADFSHMEKKAAQAAILDTLLKEFHNLKKWYDEGAKGSPP